MDCFTPKKKELFKKEPKERVTEKAAKNTSFGNTVPLITMATGWVLTIQYKLLKDVLSTQKSLLWKYAEESL